MNSRITVCCARASSVKKADPTLRAKQEAAHAFRDALHEVHAALKKLAGSFAAHVSMADDIATPVEEPNAVKKPRKE